MPRKYKPRSGSMAFYPRKKASSIIPKFNVCSSKDNNDVKPLLFYGIKVGMTDIIAKNAHKGSSSYGQDISVPVSLIETPDLRIIGGRLYKSNSSVNGKNVVSEIIQYDSSIQKRIKGKKSKSTKTIDDFLKKSSQADDLVLICAIDFKKTGAQQKTPVIVEVPLSGVYEKKIEYLKNKFGKKIAIEETFKQEQYVDVKAVTKGHGTTGPVKRFGIKTQRPKVQQRERAVGSIGPWHPATIMYTVARPGQHGFQNRVAYNKKIIMLGSDDSLVNKKGGFKNYGLIKNKYLMVAGSIPGTSKRIVAIRDETRSNVRNSLELTDISHISK